MSNSQFLTENPEAILYDIWHSLPKTAFIDIPKDILSSHPCRSTILKILQDGIEERDRITKDEIRLRHSLNAQEIRKLLSKRHKIRISKTGMYFHLKNLENAGLIFKVTKILEGRHKITYYSRSAQHLFVRDFETRFQTYEKRFGQIEKLAQALFPRSNISVFKDLTKKFIKLRREREQILGDWLVRNEDIIKSNNLDISELFEVLKILDWANPQYTTLFGKIIRFLKIDS